MASPKGPPAQQYGDTPPDHSLEESERRVRDDDQGKNDRDRSRSPPRQQKKKDFSKGFNWKKKPQKGADDERSGNYNDRAREEYRPKRHGGQDDRDRFAERNRDRDRDYDRERDRDRGRDSRRDTDRDQGRNSRRSEDHRAGDERRDKEGRGNDTRGGSNNDTRARQGDSRVSQYQDPRSKKESKEARKAAGGAGQEFIVVTVNDRLGTKARIPCLPSDTIGDFKKLVAAQIGRQPYEIMLKRQSQRPFKDSLTLADYEISNGVQLDLELDTGD